MKTIALTNKELNAPRRLTIAGDGRLVVSSASQLFVTDYSKHCVHVFQ